MYSTDLSLYRILDESPKTSFVSWTDLNEIIRDYVNNITDELGIDCYFIELNPATCGHIYSVKLLFNTFEDLTLYKLLKE